MKHLAKLFLHFHKQIPHGQKQCHSIGRKDATDEEVLAAAQLANCDEFIEKLPQYICGKNESLEKVTSDLVLEEIYDGWSKSFSTCGEEYSFGKYLNVLLYRNIAIL